MSENHEGQLAVTRRPNYITSSDTRVIAITLYNHEDQQSVGEAAANARRLVACWNACEGISTEALEIERGMTGAVEKLLIRKMEVEAQRDELLAALEWVLPLIEDYDGPDSDEAKATRAAIAKAKGGVR